VPICFGTLNANLAQFALRQAQDDIHCSNGDRTRNSIFLYEKAFLKLFRAEAGVVVYCPGFSISVNSAVYYIIKLFTVSCSLFTKIK
jgi:hypothetical protein